jgi:hypothetical protein
MMQLAVGALAGAHVHRRTPAPADLGATAVEVARQPPAMTSSGAPRSTPPGRSASRHHPRGGVAVADPGGHHAVRLVQLRPAGQPGPPKRPTDHPELQGSAPGDVVPMNPGGTQGLAVHSVDPPHSMIWGTPGDTSWLGQLEPGPAETTWLVTRILSRIRWSPMSIAFAGLIEVADFWMIRKMLLNLRERAEAMPAAGPASEAPAVAGRRRGPAACAPGASAPGPAGPTATTVERKSPAAEGDQP